jgi:YVTN family beta-propeller protein
LKISRRNLILGATGFAGCSPQLAKPYNGYAFVACSASHSVAVVNLSRFNVFKQIPVDGEPTAVLVQPGTQRVFVLVPAGGLVVEIDANTMSIAGRYKVAVSALSMRMTADGTSVWVLARDPQALVQLELNNSKVAGSIRLANSATDFDLSSAAPLAVINASPALLNLNSRKLERGLEIDGKVTLVRFRPDGKQVLAALAGTRQISIADVQTGRLLVKLPMAIEPANFCFTRDNGGQLFVTGRGMDAVAIVMPYQTAVGETILAGRAPGAMAVDDNYLFITNPEAGDLTVIAIADRRVLAKIPVGQEPVSATIVADYALILNRKSGDMAVIRISKLAQLADFRYKRAPLFTLIPLGEAPVSAAICSL